MKLHHCFLALSVLAPSLFAHPTSSPPSPSPLPTYNNNTIFQSPSDYTTPGTLYARSLQLSDGTLLATWENYSPEPPPVYFPIYSSTNLGVTWSPLSNVTDTSPLHYGLRYQPFLYLLPTAWQGFPVDTILLAGNSIPTDLSSTHIQLYASTDSGLTWSYISTIANGGEAEPTNGLTPIWEPFLLLHNDELICFYSDQRDNATHGQKLVHQSSADGGKSWGSVIDDVAFANYTQRPGMTTTAQLKDGRWIMTFEYGGGAINGTFPDVYQFPVYYKIADDPTEFGSVEATPLVATNSSGLLVVPESSPYTIVDEETGLVIVSCGTLSPVFVTMTPDDPSSWVAKETGERVSYSRSLRLVGEWKEKELLLAGGGMLPPSEGNEVAVGLISIDGWS